jgi:hypothetical protein
MGTTRSRRSVASVFLFAFVLNACSFNNGYVLDVTIDGGDRAAVAGDAFPLSASVVRGGGATDRVTWSSSDPAVATIDAEGRVASLAPGPTEITATSVSDPSKGSSIGLTVDPPGALRWTRQVGTTGSDSARAVASDASGNVFVAGSTFGVLDGSNAGGTDVFVRAYGVDGDVRWTRQFGSAANEIAFGAAPDASGHVYVVGRTEGLLDGSFAGGWDVFVRSYDADGALRWTRQFGTAGNDSVYGVGTDANGNLYVVGFTAGVLDGSSAGGFDAFLRAYDADGDLRWTRQFGTAGEDVARGVATDASGHVYVVGYTAGALDGISAGGWDGFVRAYDADGGLRWTRQFGSSAWDEAQGVAVDADGRVYVTGDTQGALDGSSAGFRDAFLRSYDADGDLRWARQFGTAESDVALAVATGANESVHVAGYTFGALEGTNAGSADAFVRTYDPDGDVRWTRPFGTAFDDFAFGLATDAGGRVYAVGATGGALDGSSAGDNDAFVRAYGR